MEFLGLLTTHPSLFLTAISVFLLALRWFLVPIDRTRTEWLIVVALIIEPADGLMVFGAKCMTYLRPLKYDLFIYQFDSLFGEPSFRLASLVGPHLGFQLLLRIVYGSLTTAVFVAFALYLLRCRSEETVFLSKALLLNALLATITYLLIPVSGPEYAFPSFPNLPNSITSLHAIPIDGAPNGIPSVHASTAMLIFWLLKRWRWPAILSGGFLVLTLLTALASGEHYLFDRFCAVPYTAFILWASAPKKEAPVATPQLKPADSVLVKETP